MALPPVEYAPRNPGGSVLSQIVREHFETFRAEALNLNVHIHALVLDGVFARAEGHLAFHATPGLSAADVADVLAAVTAGVRRLLERRGLGDGDAADRSDDFAEATPLLARLAAASVQGVVALGPASVRRPRRRGGAPGDRTERPRGASHAQWRGFDLHAGLVVPAGDRDRLERVCRYTLRPPVTDERLRLGADGQVVWQLRHPWADGTTSLVFKPTAFLARLAVLVPRPRVNLVRYHGVLAPRARWRGEVVRRQAPVVMAATSPSETPALAPARPDPGSGSRWADLMRRAFGVDVLACPRCGGRRRLIALLDESAATRRILCHLGRPWPPGHSAAYPGAHAYWGSLRGDRAQGAAFARAECGVEADLRLPCRPPRCEQGLIVLAEAAW